MEATGIIFAALDCDVDALEEWNRWYDLEHVPPNVSMPGVMSGARYVATPALHAARRCAPGSAFTAGAHSSSPSTPFADDWYRSEWAPRVVALDGVHGVASFSSATRDGLALEIAYVEGDAAAVLEMIRTNAPHHGEASIVVEAPFDRIEPLRYTFTEAIRASDLPRTVA